MPQYLKLVACSTLALLAGPLSPAQAQDMYAQPLPPVIPVRDAFGINLLNANWQYVQPVRLENKVDPDLNFQLVTTNGGAYAWRATVGGFLSGPANGYEVFQNVVIGASTYSFKTIINSNVWNDMTGMGNTLTLNTSTGIYTFTRRDGVKYSLDTTPFSSQPPGTTRACAVGNTPTTPYLCAVVTSVQYPDGKLLTYQYEGRAMPLTSTSYRTYVRMRAARSSNGVSLKLAYATDSQSSAIADWLNLTSSSVINDAYEYCTYPVGSCASQYSWPSMSYSRVLSDLPSGVHWVTATTVDAAGASHVFESSVQGWTLVAHKAGTAASIAATYRNDQGPNGGKGESNPPSFADYTGADGVKYQYRYNEVSQPYGLEIHGTRTSADGRTYSFVGNSMLPRSTVILQETDELGYVTNYNYDSNSRLTQVTFVEGNAAYYSYDANGNITQIRKTAKPGSGQSDLLEYATYPSSCSGSLLCNRPLSYTDPRGNVTSYLWDQTSGNLLMQTLPANAAGVHPVNRFGYTLMYAWGRNSSGGYSPLGAGRSILTEMRTCRTSATVGNACAAGSSDEIVTGYDYGPQSGPNNLLLRGKSVTADGVTLRTCYAYDRLGNLAAETKPNANMQACP